MEKKSFKKKFDLTADMISIDTADSNPSTLIYDNLHNSKIKTTKGTQPAEGKTKLTLSIPKDLLPEYKSWCIRHNKTMSNAFIDAFKLLKKEYGF